MLEIIRRVEESEHWTIKTNPNLTIQIIVIENLVRKLKYSSDNYYKSWMY